MPASLSWQPTLSPGYSSWVQLVHVSMSGPSSVTLLGPQTAEERGKRNNHHLSPHSYLQFCVSSLPLLARAVSIVFESSSNWPMGRERCKSSSVNHGDKENPHDTRNPQQKWTNKLLNAEEKADTTEQETLSLFKQQRFWDGPLFPPPHHLI